MKNVGEPCAGERHAPIDGREETDTIGEPVRSQGASRLPDQPRPDRGVVITLALAGIDEVSECSRLVWQ